MMIKMMPRVHSWTWGAKNITKHARNRHATCGLCEHTRGRALLYLWWLRALSYMVRLYKYTHYTSSVYVCTYHTYTYMYISVQQSEQMDMIENKCSTNVHREHHTCKQNTIVVYTFKDVFQMMHKLRCLYWCKRTHSREIFGTVRNPRIRRFCESLYLRTYVQIPSGWDRQESSLTLRTRLRSQHRQTVPLCCCSSVVCVCIWVETRNFVKCERECAVTACTHFSITHTRIFVVLVTCSISSRGPAMCDGCCRMPGAHKHTHTHTGTMQTRDYTNTHTQLQQKSEHFSKRLIMGTANTLHKHAQTATRRKTKQTDWCFLLDWGRDWDARMTPRWYMDNINTKHNIYSLISTLRLLLLMAGWGCGDSARD